MVQLPAENSILAAAVRRAADEHRLSHAVILTGRGDLTAAARFLAAAHVCEGEHKPCLTCRHCRKALEVLPLLNGCQVHCTVMLGGVDRKIFRKLGVGLTCDPAKKTR